ncbi:Threonine aldolase [Nowakowskiella sp. JEL0078]|nr:Threonine aldolase [Nowakowskiella sp. JEL0078]
MYSLAKQITKSSVVFDFRSDTVTTPTPEMRKVMSEAAVGDDVYEEDPSVNELQKYISELTGKEALFTASATMSNQLAAVVHLVIPPFSVVLDRGSHMYKNEAGGISFHTGATPITIDVGDGNLTAELIEQHLDLSEDIHKCPTKLICLENTKDGVVFPFSDLKDISILGRKLGLGLHLDGSRLWNASVKTGIQISEYCKLFDSVTLCLSKGLGAPVGSVLVGSEEFIKRAKHFRKLFGGGMRQAGILASAGLYAIENHFPNLKNDHDRAKKISDELQNLGFEIYIPTETNMVWIDTTAIGVTAAQVVSEFNKCGVKMLPVGKYKIRLVTHLQTGDDAVQAVVESAKEMKKKNWKI